MQYLQTLMENSGIQKFLQENEEMILEGSQKLSEFPQTVKDHVYANLNEFVGETPKETYDNIVIFTESAVSQFMNELVDNMAE